MELLGKSKNGMKIQTGRETLLFVLVFSVLCCVSYLAHFDAIHEVGSLAYIITPLLIATILGMVVFVVGLLRKASWSPDISTGAVLVVLALCALPTMLNILGFYFVVKEGFPEETLQSTSEHAVERIFYDLRGATLHGLLEWSSISIALLTVLLSMAHFSIDRDITTPIVGIALFCSGLMDAFHTLAALRLIDAYTPNEYFIPFTWALTRMFNAGILMIGCIIALKFIREGKAKAGLSKVVIVGLVFGVLSYAIIVFSATSEKIQGVQVFGTFFSRPLDGIAFLLFLGCAFFFVQLYRENSNFITAALVLAVIPEIFLEAHMLFGSNTIYDNHFNIAHVLKILAYLIPFAGLLLQYVRAHRMAVETSEHLERTMAQMELDKIELQKSSELLRRSNEELDSFAYIAAHDLKEPLRAINNHATFLLEDYEKILDKDGVKRLNRLTYLAGRMSQLIGDLLYYSRLGREDLAVKETDLNQVVDDIRKTMLDSLGESNASIVVPMPLPVVRCSQIYIVELFRNLITNSIKYNDNEEKYVEVGVEVSDGDVFYVKDNGIGIEEKFHDDVFRIFKRLNSIKLYGEGTGSGLTFVKKIVEKHGGRIWLESEKGKGTTFFFTLRGKQE